MTRTDHRHQAPQRFSSLASVPWILALAAAGPILFALSKYVLRLEQVSSVDDVLRNTTEAGVAALASRQWWRARALSPYV